MQYFCEKTRNIRYETKLSAYFLTKISVELTKIEGIAMQFLLRKQKNPL
jgi:hypothetical protein